MIEYLLQFYSTFKWTFWTVVWLVPLYMLFHYGIEKYLGGKEDKMTQKQLFTLVLGFFSFLAVILSLPISDSLRGQILGFFGILISAAIALSSTTFLGNTIAGLMLRSVRSFRAGDFIRVEEHFGRVSARGLFHVEIQNEDRALTTLPNLYLATNPVKVIRTSGTIVTAEVSLGYDISREEIEPLMIDAARMAELEEPFVHIANLGDFSVTYRASGLLKDITPLISVRSRLKECILDKLHEAHIEIVSPTFMNTRVVSGKHFIPKTKNKRDEEKEIKEAMPEELIFDKADQAERLEQQQFKEETLSKQIDELGASLDEAGSIVERKRIEKELVRAQKKRDSLDKKGTE